MTGRPKSLNDLIEAYRQAEAHKAAQEREEKNKVRRQLERVIRDALGDTAEALNAEVMLKPIGFKLTYRDGYIRRSIAIRDVPIPPADDASESTKRYYNHSLDKIRVRVGEFLAECKEQSKEVQGYLKDLEDVLDEAHRILFREGTQDKSEAESVRHRIKQALIRLQGDEVREAHKEIFKTALSYIQALEEVKQHIAEMEAEKKRKKGEQALRHLIEQIKQARSLEELEALERRGRDILWHTRFGRRGNRLKEEFQSAVEEKSEEFRRKKQEAEQERFRSFVYYTLTYSLVHPEWRFDGVDEMPELTDTVRVLHPFSESGWYTTTEGKRVWINHVVRVDRVEVHSLSEVPYEMTEREETDYGIIKTVRYPDGVEWLQED